jgi:hypothetical protein
MKPANVVDAFDFVMVCTKIEPKNPPNKQNKILS